MNGEHFIVLWLSALLTKVMLHYLFFLIIFFTVNPTVPGIAMACCGQSGLGLSKAVVKPKFKALNLISFIPQGD